MNDPGADEQASLAEEVYADFLARSERDEELSFEAFCREHGALEAELRRVHARWSELSGIRGHLDAAGSAYRASTDFGDREAVTVDSRLAEGGDAPQALIERLQARSTGFDRYQIEREIGRGGMGRVLRVWDPDLRRTLAMKVVRSSSVRSAVDPRLLARFLEEAQISGQLDHPGIVPLHEIGMTRDGEVYFTMKLVHGESLREVYEQCERGEGGWTRPRVIGVLQKVCEAVSYAHAKGVLHRDLKPSNVMVGHFGEVYVMDWGLARILGEVRQEWNASASGSARRRAPVQSDRRDASDSNPESPIYTVEGDVIGTPAYMPPEQAEGLIDAIGPRADVYSIGAMLYQHLTGCVPYVQPGESIGAGLLIVRVRQGPPAPVHRLAPSAPAELVAICERAMARSPDDRYPSVSELGNDLRAFLEGRVVRAYRTGALVELKKWVARNRTQAITAGLAVLALLAGLVVSTSLLFEVRASESRVMRMSDVKRLYDLSLQAETLFPAHPELEGAYLEWLAEAEELLERLDLHRGTLEELRRGSPELTDSQSAADRESHPEYPLWTSYSQRLEELEGWLAGMDANDPEVLRDIAYANIEAPALPSRESIVERIEELEAILAAQRERIWRRRTWFMPTLERQWQHDTLAQLVRDLEDFSDPERGLMLEIRLRLETARLVRELSLEGPEAVARWEEARASLVDPDRCPEYGGLEIEPQVGLLPIGRDPWSGLWEFALVSTGEVPERDAEGELSIGEETALVFVLVPGGTFWMGAQRRDPAGRNYDPLADPEEEPVHQVKVEPFFLSKYEMTQSQWEKETGTRPAYYKAGNYTGGVRITGRHPVEQISWEDSARVLARLGLELPTEAQWEHAVRAYTDTPWFDGPEKEALTDAANLGDRTAREKEMPWGPFDEWLEDGHAIHAPVGSFRASPWGFHDVYGNVLEPCKDLFGAYTRETDPVTGERIGYSTNRVLRGGSFDVTHVDARVSRRAVVTPTFNGFNLGVRPARALD